MAKAEITVKQECKLWQLLSEDIINTKTEAKRLLLAGKITVNGKEVASIESVVKTGDMVVVR